MNRFRASILLGLIACANSAVRADEAPKMLPKDGWWVRYFVTMNFGQPNDEQTIKRKYSLVGTVTENDQKCRWVEMKSVQSVNGKEQTDIIKFLVPEKELLESEKPLESLIRAWRQLDGGQA